MAVKLADAFVQISATAEGLQQDVANQLAALGGVSKKAGKDVGTQFTQNFGKSAKGIDSGVKSDLGGLETVGNAAGKGAGSRLSTSFKGEVSGLDSAIKSDLSGLGSVGSAAGQDIGSSMSDEIESSLNNADYESFGSSISGKISKGFAAAGGILGVAGAGAFAGLGKSVAGEIAQINNQLGYTGAAAEGVGDSVDVALRSGVASSAEEAAGAIGALEGQFKYLGFEGEQTAGELSDNFLAVARTFDVDLAESTQVAGQLIQNGLAPDVESAADLMTTALQRVPQAMRGETLDAINEYGTNFSNLGFTGEEAFSLIVGASEQGQYAIDKTGDAIKEYSVLAIDPAKAEAFEALGMNAEDAASSVAAGGEGARKTLEETAQALLDIEDPGQRAALAVELFGAPIEDLGVDKIPAFLQNLTGVEDAMGGAEGASQALADTMSESLGGRMDALTGTVQSLAADAFMYMWDTVQNQIIPAFQSLGEWFQRNEQWIKPLSVTVGVLTAGYAALAIQQRIVAAGGLLKFFTQLTTITKLQTAATAAFNVVMSANPIMLVVIAVAALVAGLVYFFTQTEVGQEIWGKFTTALSDGWNWFVDVLGAGWNWIQENVWNPFMTFLTETIRPIWDSVWGGIQSAWDTFVGALQWGWENIIRPVFDAIWQVAQVTIGVIGTLILAPLMIAWNALSTGIQWGWENFILPAWERLQAVATFMWENVLQPVFQWIGDRWNSLTTGISGAWTNILQPAWQAVQNAATWMWENVLMPVFNFIGNAWNLLVTGIQWYWENVLKVAWEAVQNAAVWMYENVLMPIFQWIGDRWTDLSNAIRWAYDNIIKPAWDALAAALTWLYENVVRPVLQWFQDRWNDMANALHAGWRWIDENVFQSLSRGLDWLKGVFQSAVDGIGTIWDGLKGAAARPVKFVIDTVWNNGILKAWNMIADFLPGIDTVDPYEPAWLGNYATGGVLPGYTPGRDPHEFFSPTGGRIALSGGEAIMRPEWTRAVGGPAAVERMNADARHGRIGNSERYPGKRHGDESAAFAKGGIFDLGNFNTGGIIGAMMNIVSQKYPQLQMTSGYRPGAGRYHGTHQATDWSNGSGNTPAQLALAHDIAQTYPGSAQLIYDSPGWSGNIANGANVGAFGGYYNMAEAGPHHHHVHWAMTDAPTMPFGGGVFEGGSDGTGGGGIMNWISEKARGIWDNIVSPIKGWIDDKKEAWGDSKFAEIPMGFLTSVKDAAWSKISGLFGSGGAGNVDTSGVVGSNVEIGQQLAAQVGWTGSEWEALKELWTLESQWDNNAQNPSSTAYGIPQFLDQTWASVGYTKTSDPATQIAAGIKYIQQRPDYGGLPSNALSAWWSRDPHWYDEGGYIQPGTTLVQNDTGKPEPVLNPAQWQIFKQVLRQMPFLTESMQVVAKEIGAAFGGGDYGYSELARVLGNEEWAKAIVDGSATLGTISREVGAAVAPVARESGEEYLAAQATSALDIVGLGGLVPLGQEAGAAVWDAYQASPVEVGFDGQRVVLEIDAEGGDFVHIDKVEELASRIHGLEVRVNRKPPAATATRGGPM